MLRRRPLREAWGAARRGIAEIAAPSRGFAAQHDFDESSNISIVGAYTPGKITPVPPAPHDTRPPTYFRRTGRHPCLRRPRLQ
jgi:hypothetical protein